MKDPQVYQVALVADQLTDVTGGAGVTSNGTFDLNICNLGNQIANFRVAIVPTGSAGASHWIDYEKPLGAVGSGRNSFSKYPIPLKAGWKVFVQSSRGNVSATLIGL